MLNTQLTLYKVFLIISMFISSKSCSDMHSTKNGAANNILSLSTDLLLSRTCSQAKHYCIGYINHHLFLKVQFGSLFEIHNMISQVFGAYFTLPVSWQPTLTMGTIVHNATEAVNKVDLLSKKLRFLLQNTEEHKQKSLYRIWQPVTICN